MATPKNIDELRRQLLDAFDWVKTDPRRAGQVCEMVNAAGKVINSVKCELEYAAIRKENVCIPFLHYGERDAGSLERPQVSSGRMLKQIHSEIEDKKAKQ